MELISVFKFVKQKKKQKQKIVYVIKGLFRIKEGNKIFICLDRVIRLMKLSFYAVMFFTCFILFNSCVFYKNLFLCSDILPIRFKGDFNKEKSIQSYICKS